MPLHVDIRVNRELINTVHIGRIQGTTDPDSENSYLIVEGDEPLGIKNWEERGVPFKHVYGDGANVCVMLGLLALENSKIDNG